MIPVLYNRRLFLHLIIYSLYLLVPNSQSIPPLTLPLGNHKSVLYVFESFLFHEWVICAVSNQYFRFHVYILYGICLLSKLAHLV